MDMLGERKILWASLAVFAAMAFAGCVTGSPTPSAANGLFPDVRPGPEWTPAEAPGWSNRTGFSLMLPPGWKLNELQGIDSYVGEVTGDGVNLMFDYGSHSWGLNPEDEPEHEYIVHFEKIGDRDAKLLLPADTSSSESATYEPVTGVYFSDLHDGNELNLTGRGLTLEQQLVAVAIFRSIRFPE